MWVVGLLHWWYQKQSGGPPRLSNCLLTPGGLGLRPPDRARPVNVCVGVAQRGDGPVSPRVRELADPIGFIAHPLCAACVHVALHEEQKQRRNKCPRERQRM